MMTYSLQMAEARARWAPKTNGQVAPQQAPRTEQKLAEVTQRIEALEARLSQFSTEFHRMLADKPQPAQPDPAPRRPTPAYIIRVVAREFKFTEAEVLSLRKDESLVLARHIAMHLCLRLTLHSLSVIGKYFRRDHTTVMYARDRIAKQRAADEQLRDQLSALEAKLYPEDAA